MIKCPACGFDNPPGHLYCVKCKKKLDLEQITPEYLSAQQHRLNPGRQILLASILLLMTFAVLAFWPPHMDTFLVSRSEGEKARNKVAMLQQGAAKEAIEFSEEEVNALFNFLIQQNRQRKGRSRGPAAVYAGRVKIKSKSISIRIVYKIGPWPAGPLTIGPVWLSYKVSGVPKHMPDGLHFAPSGGSVGHLPLPFLGGNLGMTRLKRIFAPFKNACDFLAGLEVIEMKKGGITVSRAR